MYFSIALFSAGRNGGGGPGKAFAAMGAPGTVEVLAAAVFTLFFALIWVLPGDDPAADNIAARFSLRGALNRATLLFDGTGALTTERDITNIRIEGQGALAGAPLRLCGLRR